MADFYRMPAFATLAVSDIEKSVKWYQTALGFSLVFTMPSADGGKHLCHLRLSKYADIMLVSRPTSVSGSVPNGVIFLTFALFNESVDEVAERLLRLGDTRFEGPFDRPWNAREIIITDPDGFKIVMTAPIDSTSTIDDVVASVQALTTHQFLWSLD
ncbi:VOC family protein [Nguyenibacter vanlangensis]|uniref:VOC family protein n=1 Tax=Nguyenibacter vanlangensis TaxID=1216886 RepID=A0ABZ3D8Z9_9PROT